MYTQEEITKPFGPYTPPENFTQELIQEYIDEIQLFPSELEAFYRQLRPEHLEACYREGGWNFRQIFHHIPDSHIHAYARFKYALTEQKAVIKPYDQDAWAELEDSLICDPELSLQLLKPLHKRWVTLLTAMEPADFNKIYIHPEYNREYTLAHATGLYAWHGRHHLAQMQRYASNEGWI